MVWMTRNQETEISFYDIWDMRKEHLKKTDPNLLFLEIDPDDLTTIGSKPQEDQHGSIY